MAFDPQALSDREKAVLRLLAQGFDAKSAARELGISLHTVNERLRRTRSKLQVTSSREAARLLRASERRDTEFLVYKEIGVGTNAIAVEGARPESDGAGTRRTYALIAGGFVAMSLVILAAFLTVTAAPTAELGPLPNWRLAAALPAGLSKQRNEVHLDGNRLLWNGGQVSEANIRAFLAIVRGMDPQPLTILSYGVQATPERIQRERLLIDGALSCKAATCLEVTQPQR